MTIANRLIAALNDAKANGLTVEIKDQDDGRILTVVSGGIYQEDFLSGSLEYLVRRLEMTVDDWRLI